MVPNEDARLLPPALGFKERMHSGRRRQPYEAHVENSSLPSHGPDGPAQICVGVATMPAGPYEGHVENTSDPPELMIAPLRVSRPNLRAVSQCDSKRGDKDITLAVGWPVVMGEEIVVAVDRLCWWTCASGYKIRLRRAKDGFEFVAQAPDRWVREVAGVRGYASTRREWCAARQWPTGPNRTGSGYPAHSRRIHLAPSAKVQNNAAAYSVILCKE